jgi:hypothetical protein
MLEIAELERQLRRGAELQGLEAPSTPQPTTPGGKRRSLPAFMQTRDAGGQLGSSSSLPALPSAHGRVPREAPTLILPNAFDASIFDATAVYETTQDAHNHGSRQLFERTREAVQEASAAAYNAGQMAAEAAATAGRKLGCHPLFAVHVAVVFSILAPSSSLSPISRRGSEKIR